MDLKMGAGTKKDNTPENAGPENKEPNVRNLKCGTQKQDRKMEL